MRANARRALRSLRQSPAKLAKAMTMQDLREFLMAYCACFAAVSAFIW